MGRHSAVLVTSVVLVVGLVGAACSDDTSGTNADPGSTDADPASTDVGGGSTDACPEPDTPAPVELEVGVINELADGGAEHMACDVGYPSSPPASGVHFDAWQNCGFYTAAVRDHTAVHALEHGAVWIAYAPDTDEGTLEAISSTVAGSTHLLAAPYPELANPIVLTAWRRQLAVDAWDDPLVDEFIGDFAGRVSPTAPEAGASCEGAVGVAPDLPDESYDAILADILNR